MASSLTQLPIEGDLPSLAGATAWLNSPPLEADGLRGKVALIDFWTYTCVNWQRTFPYVRAWYEKYKGNGLVVIGVHTPEFPFEGDLENVRIAARQLGVDYPIAVDTDYAIWRAFKNEYWPALYVVDAKGHIRYHKFGEGDYARSESVIQHVLAQAGGRDVPQGSVSVDPSGALVGADWDDLESGETYLGYERTTGFASPAGLRTDLQHVYAQPAKLELNQWALSGAWTAHKGAVALNDAGGRIAFRFHGRDVNLIMGPTARGASIRFRVLIDGKSPGPAHGSDVAADGHGVLTEPRMYQLIRQPKPIIDRTFEVEFLDAGAEAFDFTFG